MTYGRQTDDGFQVMAKAHKTHQNQMKNKLAMYN